MNSDPVSGKTHRMLSCRVARSHSRISPPFLWVILLILVFPAHCLAGEGKLINITVAADHTKANGEPWDGIPSLGAGRGPAIPILNKDVPPDLAVCVVRLKTPPECSMRYVELKQYSICQNSYNCIFKRVSIPDGPFGLIILDLDFRRHDLGSRLIKSTIQE